MAKKSENLIPMKTLYSTVVETTAVVNGATTIAGISIGSIAKPQIPTSGIGNLEATYFRKSSFECPSN
jgi:hypothetical protein